MIELTHFRALRYGSVVETFVSEKGFCYGHGGIYDTPPRAFVRHAPRSRRDFSVKRARRLIRQLVEGNASRNFYDNKFFTFTFGDLEKPHNPSLPANQDLKITNPLFRAFIRRFNAYLGYSLKYIAVVEFQPVSARVHYHVVFFNLPQFLEVSLLESIWSHGFVKPKLIRDVEHIGNYLVKYLIKSTLDIRLIGRKCYFTSIGLARPDRFYHASELEFAGIDLSLDYRVDLKLSSSYDTHWLGHIDHKFHRELT